MEILEEIFFLCLDFECSPRTLAQVCRYWYQITVNKSSFWSYIHIELPPIEGRGTYGKESRHPSRSSCGRKEICTTNAELNQTLTRSGNAPLKILITGWGGHFARLALLQPLFHTDISPRIEALDLRYETNQTSFNVIIPTQTKFTSLRRLVVGTDVVDDPIANYVIEHAPKLDDLTFFRSTRGRPPWIGIKSLKIDHKLWLSLKRFEYQSRQPIDLDSIAPSCKSIKYLGTYMVIWPTVTTPTIYFKNLSELSLRCNDLECLTRLQLPVLRCFRLWSNTIGEPDSDEIDLLTDYTVLLPELTTLVARVASAARLTSFRCPKLRNLDLETTRSSLEWDNTNLSMLKTGVDLSFPAVQSLKLVTWASNEAIVDYLGAFPNVVEFQLQTIDYKNHQIPKPIGTTGYAFLVTLTEGSDEIDGLVLPRLRELYLGGVATKITIPGPTAMSAIENLLKSRAPGHGALKKVVIHWDNYMSERVSSSEAFYLEDGQISSFPLFSPS